MEVYALGLVLLEALSGEKPRESSNVEAALAQARAGAMRPPPTDAPPALLSIAGRATRLHASERYPGAHDMLEDLEAFLRDEPCSARVLADTLRDLFDGPAVFAKDRLQQARRLRPSVHLGVGVGEILTPSRLGDAAGPSAAGRANRATRR